MAVEAVELLSGKAATIKVAIADPESSPLNLMNMATAPVLTERTIHRLLNTTFPTLPHAEVAFGVASRDFTPVDESFGPHVRDMVVTDGGKLAVLNTMNWDHNLYAVDVQSGKVRWRQRAGHYFAFEPTALDSGVAVQGFDMKSTRAIIFTWWGPRASFSGGSRCTACRSACRIASFRPWFATTSTVLLSAGTMYPWSTASGLPAPATWAWWSGRPTAKSSGSKIGSNASGIPASCWPWTPPRSW